ncbi:hypothetical protein [Bradyrhizobium sp. SHOUNA76]|uniref:hypothetical protein n=1 Tax=Bradyrhizobium sp. SHOUNA76 TaxID=2908927 RepID=UPI001FF355FD|nr:hypothetical protein [Bradyrhizobium sp. SHOUNA76]MCJ9700856.1 hypothetical protein [Bradyrhizobium sp. SHOUNA76]
MTDDEILTLRVTVIGGERCEHDYEVIWHGLSIGRIRRAEASSRAELWAWNCWLYGRPCKADEAGGGASLDDAKAQFREAWHRIRARLTEADIARAKGYAERGGCRRK